MDGGTEHFPGNLPGGVQFNKSGQGPCGTFCKRIHKLMLDNGDWATYDMSFHKMVERYANKWGNTHRVLYSRALNLRNTQNTKKHVEPLTPQSFKKLRVPPGWYIDHHAHSKCTRNPCPWNHTCFNCRVADHPVSDTLSACRLGNSRDFHYRNYSLTRSIHWMSIVTLSRNEIECHDAHSV